MTHRDADTARSHSAVLRHPPGRPALRYEGQTMRARWSNRHLPVFFTSAAPVVQVLAEFADHDGEYAGGYEKLQAEAQYPAAEQARRSGDDIVQLRLPASSTWAQPVVDGESHVVLAGGDRRDDP